MSRVNAATVPIRGVRLGIDVGGTFTDVLAVLGDRRVRGKVRSTPDDPGAAVVSACELVAAELGCTLSGLLAQVERFGLGTTVVTNVLATHSGRRLGLLTTRGFEDLVPLARGSRIADDGWLLPPPTLVDRTAIVGLAERVDRDGRVLQAVNPEEAARAVDGLMAEEQVEAVVVSLLWSFRNPVNEHAVRDAVAARHPDLPVLLGSELSPVIREYERTQFALMNAYVGGALDWLSPLAEHLRREGLVPPIVLTHSNGGATTVEGARAVPIGLAQSGPSAGAAAASRILATLEADDAVTCDLGGTSLDVALVAGGQALRRTRGEVVGHWTALSMVDVDSVGSGGGSVAWVDPVGAIRVGPRSAGAVPGPACYGQGGVEATLTDALVVLGYIDPARFLDGRMPLDADRATAACADLGAQVGIGAVEAAWGIREVALATMARAVRNRIASRGLVAGDLALLAYGGCGGLFGDDIAREVGARGAVVPELAPVFSAYGAATAPLRRERSRSVAERLPGDRARLLAVFEGLRQELEEALDRDGVSRRAPVRYEADVRFERQGAELTVELAVAGNGADGGTVPDLDGLAERFIAEYVLRFGQGAVAMGVGVEAMTLRVIGSEADEAGEAGDAGVALLPDGAARRSSAAPVKPAAPSHRSVRIERNADALVRVHELSTLAPGVTISGPALVDAGDTTVWVGPGRSAFVDDHGSLLIGGVR